MLCSTAPGSARTVHTWGNAASCPTAMKPHKSFHLYMNRSLLQGQKKNASTQSTNFQEQIHMQLHRKIWIATAATADIMHAALS